MQGIAPEAVDFTVTTIRHVVERFPDPGWGSDRVFPRPGAEEPPRAQPQPQSSVSHCYILAYALSGSSHYIINGRHYDIGPNDLIFLKKGSTRLGRSDADTPWHFYSLSFDIEFASEACRSFIHSLPDVLSGYAIHLLPVLMDEVTKAWTGKRAGYLIQCRGLIMQALFILIRMHEYSLHNITHYEDIERVIDTLQGNYVDHYSNEDLARMANMSCSHFRSLFRKVTGMSPINYQIRMKINKAQSLLLTGQYTVSQVSALLGFKSIYYFSHLFKKTTGISPSDLRRGAERSAEAGYIR